MSCPGYPGIRSQEQYGVIHKGSIEQIIGGNMRAMIQSQQPPLRERFWSVIDLFSHSHTYISRHVSCNTFLDVGNLTETPRDESHSSQY